MHVLDFLKYLAAKRCGDSEPGASVKRLAAAALQTSSRERLSNRIVSPDELPALPEGESGMIVRGLSGEYRIGGRAELSVFKAIHTATHRSVILRLFAGAHRDEHIPSASGGLAIRGTPHPAIAMVLEEGDIEAGHYIIREFVEGPSLQRVIDERGRLSTQECVDLAAQLAEVLEVSHRRGMAHGRLSASNVFIEPGGAVKVTDWNERAQNDAPGDFETVRIGDLRKLGSLLTAAWAGASLQYGPRSPLAPPQTASDRFAGVLSGLRRSTDPQVLIEQTLATLSKLLETLGLRRRSALSRLSCARDSTM